MTRRQFEALVDSALRKLPRAFRDKLYLLVAGLNTIPGFKCLEPRSTFYAFPKVAEVCNKLGITSHGLALYFWKGPTTRRGSRASAASASVRRAAASCDLAAPSLTTS